MTEKRITEAELVLPTLYLMEQNGGSITTSELIPKLTEFTQQRRYLFLTKGEKPKES